MLTPAIKALQFLNWISFKADVFEGLGIGLLHLKDDVMKEFNQRKIDREEKNSGRSELNYSVRNQ